MSAAESDSSEKQFIVAFPSGTVVLVQQNYAATYELSGPRTPPGTIRIVCKRSIHVPGHVEAQRAF